MTPSLLTVLVVLSYVIGNTKACSITADWAPWNITQRAQRADIVVVGTVVGYYPIFQHHASPLFYTAEVDVSCVFGVLADASAVARNIFDNSGVVNVVGFNPAMVQCPTSQVDIAVNQEYIFWVIGEWSGGNMRPQEINSQPAAVMAQTSFLTEFSDTMKSGSHMGYRLKSRGCDIDNGVDVVDMLSTTTTKGGLGGGTKGTSKITPKRVVGKGSGYRLQVCWTSLLFSILLIAVFSF
ncbi:uncharacterized protein LOC135153522 [Lytechinus pictus]|uniref:uncharacterized protein LOC135153522 n=1 Tax=Lytechinus pictus TaxID=7653 RepID=UPI0030B9B7F2